MRTARARARVCTRETRCHTVRVVKARRRCTTQHQHAKSLRNTVLENGNVRANVPPCCARERERPLTTPPHPRAQPRSRICTGAVNVSATASGRSLGASKMCASSIGTYQRLLKTIAVRAIAPEFRIAMIVGGGVRSGGVRARREEKGVWGASDRGSGMSASFGVRLLESSGNKSVLSFFPRGSALRCN